MKLIYHYRVSTIEHYYFLYKDSYGNYILYECGRADINKNYVFRFLVNVYKKNYRFNYNVDSYRQNILMGYIQNNDFSITINKDKDPYEYARILIRKDIRLSKINKLNAEIH